MRRLSDGHTKEPRSLAHDLQRAEGAPEARGATERGAARRTASVVVELRVDIEGLRIRSSNSQTVSVQAGKDVSVRWQACGAAAGSYVVVARATIGGAHVDSQARLLTIGVANRKASC